MYKMYGTIIGDIAGSTYELKNIKYSLDRKDLINKRSEFTDDTVMALAVAKGIYEVFVEDDSELIGNKDKQDKLYLSIQERLPLIT